MCGAGGTLGLVSLGGVDAQFVELVEVGLEEVSDHGGLLVVDDDDSGDEEEVLGVDVVGEWMSYGSDGNVCPPESQTRGESLSIFAVLERRCPSSVFSELDIFLRDDKPIQSINQFGTRCLIRAQKASWARLLGARQSRRRAKMATLVERTLTS